MTKFHLTIVVAVIVGAASGPLVSRTILSQILPQSPSSQQENAEGSNQAPPATESVDGTNAASVSSALASVAKTINASSPVMLDQETRLDTAVAGPGSRLTYVYTLVNRAKKDLNISQVRQNLRSQTLANYKTHPSMRELRENNVELRYRYKDRRGEVLFEFSIAPKDF
jgi:hypothetical protein